MVGPARKREAVAHVCQRLEASERRACRKRSTDGRRTSLAAGA
jgi:hypothetical protein